MVERQQHRIWLGMPAEVDARLEKLVTRVTGIEADQPGQHGVRMKIRTALALAAFSKGLVELEIENGLRRRPGAPKDVNLDPDYVRDLQGWADAAWCLIQDDDFGTAQRVGAPPPKPPKEENKDGQ